MCIHPCSCAGLDCFQEWKNEEVAVSQSVVLVCAPRELRVLYGQAQSNIVSHIPENGPSFWWSLLYQWKILSSFETTKRPDPDELHPRMLNWLANVHAEPLTGLLIKRYTW